MTCSSAKGQDSRLAKDKNNLILMENTKEVTVVTVMEYKTS